MKNLNIAVVGANRGIGLELTKQLSESGNKVYAFCRTTSEPLLNLKNVIVVKDFEVTNFSKMSDQLKTLDFSFGDYDQPESEKTNLDLLIHVSGIYRSDSIDEINEEEIIEQFTVNSLAPILSVKAFLPYLKESSKVGLITSRMGSVADNTSGGMYGYRMSKAALNMAGKSLSEDLKDDDITVLLLHPGYVKTDMTGHQGQITAKESALGLIKILEEKSLKDSGTFWHMNGEQLPW
jgi:NAD(P)-dependent dehydrogenase (short-subunit alcohol dehydrogenase family)